MPKNSSPLQTSGLIGCKVPLSDLAVKGAFLLVLLGGLIWLSPSAARAAIVNIEDLRPDSGQVGGSGKLDLSFSRSSGNTNILALQAQNAFAWTREASESLFILNYRYGESGDEVNVNQGLGHLRYVRATGESTAAEMFTQLQKDEFKRLSYRVLAGGNFRAGVYDTAQVRLFLGVGAFYSHERLAAVNGVATSEEDAVRGNVYLSYRYSWKEGASLSSTVYYQPRADRSEDLHVLWDSSLRVHLVKELHLRLSYELLYDSRPPEEVVSTDQRYFSGLSWSY